MEGMTRSPRDGCRDPNPLPPPRAPACAAESGRVGLRPAWLSERGPLPPLRLLGWVGDLGLGQAGVPHLTPPPAPRWWGQVLPPPPSPRSQAAPLNSCGGHRRIRRRPALLARLEPIPFQA